MAHWIEFLQEGGKQIEIIKGRLLSKQKQVQSLKSLLETAQNEFADEEKEALSIIQKAWSNEEIQEAKKEFTNFYKTT